MYYIVKHNFTSKVIGPATDWRIACMAEFGSIEQTMLFKVGGLTKMGAVEAMKHDNGWFSPIIIGEPARIAFSAERVFTSTEVKQKLRDLSSRILKAATKQEAVDAKDKAAPFLRVVPIAACEKFSNLFNKVMERFNESDN